MGSDVISPIIVLATIIAVISVVNIYLWIFLKRKFSQNLNSTKAREDISLSEIKGKIDAGLKKTDKMEDQLWGVIDKLKNIENLKESMENEFSRVKSLEDGDKKKVVILKAVVRELKEMKKNISYLKNETGKKEDADKEVYGLNDSDKKDE